MKRASLNHVFRLAWSDVLQAFVAVADVAKGRGKKSSGAVTLVAAALLGVGSAWANDALPTQGSVVAGTGSISQSGSTMTVNQSTSQMAIDWQSFSVGAGNTVNFVQPSASAVALNRVLGSDVSVIQGAINANGQVLLLNPNGVLFTPTAQVNVGAMVASTLNLSTADFLNGNYRFEGASSHAVINQGNITAAPGGIIALIAARITNAGHLTTERGNVLIGAGSRVTLDLGGPVKIQVEQGAIDALIEQGGAIKADGGLLYLTARAAGNLVSTVINHTGISEAQTLATGERGEIFLMGDMATGRIAVGGKLDASASLGGDGGFIETSAANVQIQPGLVVTTQSHNGLTGEWLIDPNDYTVAASGGDMTGTQLSAHLASNNVIIQSVNGGNALGNGDIFVNDAVSWLSGNTLTLNAIRHIEVNAPIDASGGSGGKLALRYGQGATDGVISGVSATYTINAPVRLQNSGAANGNNGTTATNFSTQLGSGGDMINYTVINSQSPLQAMTLNGNYALGSSLTLSGNWTAIGRDTSGQQFTGRLDGLGNRVIGLSINVPGTTDYQGLFGFADGAVLSNITLQNVTISGGRFMGALVGQANATQIHNAQAQNVLITGERGIGGLVGFMSNFGSITASGASGETRGNGATDIAFHGGLVGIVEGGASVGQRGGNIRRSHARVNVATNTGARVSGGLVGLFRGDGVIEDSYSTGNVFGRASTGANGTGGLVGRLGAASDSAAQIVRAYATGAVSVRDATASPVLGGLVGFRVAGTSIDRSFWDINTTGQTAGVGSGGSTGTTPLGIGILGGTSGPFDRSPYNLGEFVEGVHTYGTLSNGTWFGFDFTNTWWMVDGVTRPFLRNEWRQNITNAQELQLIAIKPHASYILANNIDLAPSLTNQSEMWRGTGGGSSFQGSWLPIANFNNAFSGSFDGNNRAILNLNISSDVDSRNYGLFDTIRNGTVKDLTLSGGRVNYLGSSSPAVGALAGKVLGDSTITHVTSDLSVSGNNHVGGLIGEVRGDSEDGTVVSIRHSSSSGEVFAEGAMAGGLLGAAVGATIANSHATGHVTGDADANEFGGLVGVLEDSTVEASYATGNVTVDVDADNAGGLVGTARGGARILTSYATGNVTAAGNSQNIGGLAGYVESATVTKSYATGRVMVSGEGRQVGGLIGFFLGNGNTSAALSQVTDSFALGDVAVGDGSRFGVGGLLGVIENGYVARTYSTGRVSAGVRSTDVGGLVGLIFDSAVVDSYWDIDTSGQSVSAGGSGRTTPQMKDISTFVGWNIVADPSLDDINPYPRLRMSGNGPVWTIKSLITGGGEVPPTIPRATESAILQLVQSQLTEGQNVQFLQLAGGINLMIITGQTLPADLSGSVNLSNGLALVEIPSEEIPLNLLQSGAGRDASGFMKVFVVRGGIRLSQLDESEGQSNLN